MNFNELEQGVELRQHYMNKISSELKSLENLLRMSGLGSFGYKNFHWKKCPHNNMRLFYHDGKEFKKLIESPFNIREKAYSEGEEFVKHVSRMMKENNII